MIKLNRAFNSINKKVYVVILLLALCLILSIILDSKERLDHFITKQFKLGIDTVISRNQHLSKKEVKKKAPLTQKINEDISKKRDYSTKTFFGQDDMSREKSFPKEIGNLENKMIKYITTSISANDKSNNYEKKSIRNDDELIKDNNKSMEADDIRVKDDDRLTKDREKLSNNENITKENIFPVEIDSNFELNREAIKKGLNFDIKKNALAFMHIQKTSGKEFDKKFIADLMVRYDGKWERACHKHFEVGGHNGYDCNLGGKTDWYLSRATNGWPCEIHANYAQIKNCYPRVAPKYDSDDIIVFTMLRNPITRYLSEWNHIARVGN